MAGKRQHYVPRFLQRGFLSPEPGFAESTWLHRRDSSPELVGIGDIGVSKYFYSKPSKDGSLTLDDLITNTESPIVGQLEAIRSATPGTIIQSAIAASMVVHLTFRTAHVRSSLTQAASLVVDRVADYVSSGERMRKELGVDSSHSSGLIGQVLSLAPIANLPVPPEFARRFIAFFVREQFDELYEETKPQLYQAISNLTDVIPQTIQEAHKKMLLQSDLSGRINALGTLSWRTQAVVGALLPDCIALVRERSSDAYVPLLLSNWDEVDCVVLPIAHDRLLVGSKGDQENLSISAINEASSLCSDNFFISRDSDDVKQLTHLIGQRCAQTISENACSALAGIADGELQQKESVATCRDIDGEAASSEFSFELRCSGLGDDNMIAALAKIVRGIAQEVGRDMPLRNLDGMTFATNYPLAVEQLDRGDPHLATERSQPRDYGRAVAKCIKVRRDGQTKEHIVFDSAIAEELLKERSEWRDGAIHMVINMIAQVAQDTLFEQLLEDADLTPPDDISSLLHRCVSAAPSMYYAARHSAFADPSAGARYACLVIDSYTSARQAIREARMAYRLDANLDSLLDVALPRIGFTLEHAAQWLGHRDGLHLQDSFPGFELMEHLKTFELDRWLELFGRDLKSLYVTDDQFSAQNIFSLSRHAERLLWTVQICPWPTKGGGTYVSVPLGEDDRP